MNGGYTWGNAGSAFFLTVLLACGLEGYPEQRSKIAEPCEAVAVLPDAPDPQTPPANYKQQSNRCPSRPGMDYGAPTCDQPTSVNSKTMARHTKQAPVVSGKGPPGLYRTFIGGPKTRPLTRLDKAWLAARNTADPFNLLTVGGEATISVAVNPHSPYGPGLAGFGRSVGVSISQDVTGEVFGTFLIPALTHQDPLYHRVESRSIPRRVAHATVQIFWTRTDSGKRILNYANLVGFAIHDEIGNLYVPGRRTDGSATAERYATGLATAPIGNFVDEFLPDLASHIHVQHVILRRIVNQVAQKETAGSVE